MWESQHAKFHQILCDLKKMWWNPYLRPSCCSQMSSIIHHWVTLKDDGQSLAIRVPFHRGDTATHCDKFLVQVPCVFAQVCTLGGELWSFGGFLGVPFIQTNECCLLKVGVEINILLPHKKLFRSHYSNRIWVWWFRGAKWTRSTVGLNTDYGHWFPIPITGMWNNRASLQ